MNPLDDQYTILYRHVYENHYPKQFYQSVNNRVVSIFDYFEKKIQHVDFFHKDLMMIYFESFFNGDELTDYKNWIIQTEGQSKIKKLSSAMEQKYDIEQFEPKEIGRAHV